MHSAAIPGLREIFPGEQSTYVELVQTLGSDTIIRLCAALNSELTCPEPGWEIQARLNLIVAHRFTDEQRRQIFIAIKRFNKKSGNGFQGLIFLRRYLVAMLLKELNNYRTVTGPDNRPEHEYQFLKAYLTIIDEVNDMDHGDIDFGKLDESDPFSILRLCWLPVLRQFEFNEKGSMIFEMLKTACFLEYAAKNFREPLRDYLNSFGLSSPAELISSFNSIYQSTEMYDPSLMLRKLTLITVNASTNAGHLKAQTVSPEINGKLRFNDLKKYPVFFSPKRGNHIVLDNYLAQRKVFKGAYFDLFHQTSLKPVEKALQNEAFVRYSQKVADVLEKHCLKSILTLLAKQDCDVMHFDDGSDSVPDGYLRIGRTIFLFEYKAYFFPERLAGKSDFDELKAYFDRGFIANEKGKEKGVHQLRKQIKIIYGGGFAFDPDVGPLLETGGLTIFPVITYNDFYFGINGLNAYLNDAFFRSLPKEFAGKLTIVPIVLMNLESLLDMVLTGQGISQLENHIHRFLGLANQAQQTFQFSRRKQDFLAAYAGFDELYNWQFASGPGELDHAQEVLQRLLELAGISFEELERPIE